MAKDKAYDHSEGRSGVSDVVDDNETVNIEAVAAAVDGDGLVETVEIDEIAAAVSSMTKPANIKPKANLPAIKPETRPVMAAAKKRVAVQAKPAANKGGSPTSAPVEIKKLKEKIMDTTTETNAAAMSHSAEGMQDRVRTAFAKSTAMLSEMRALGQGNVEAMVEAGKIFTDGLQSMSREVVEESKSAYETMAADAKTLAAAKSPTEFMQLQGEFLRRNFDAAISTSARNTEAMVKLANDAFAPVSNRMSVAMDKVSKAA